MSEHNQPDIAAAIERLREFYERVLKKHHRGFRTHLINQEHLDSIKTILIALQLTPAEVEMVERLRHTPFKRLRRARYSDGENEVKHVRKLLNDSGYDASPEDIEVAYGEWCENRYSASWLPFEFFKPQNVESFVSDFMENNTEADESEQLLAIIDRMRGVK